MKLGDLEFKAGDFGDLSLRRPVILFEDAALLANRILAEKLEKAQIIYAHCGKEEWHVHGTPPEENLMYTHGRLVCIEERRK